MQQSHLKSHLSRILSNIPSRTNEKGDIHRKACYLAGPMTGIRNFNFPAFEDAAHVLRTHGWFVYSPRENDEERGEEARPDGVPSFPLKHYMVDDLAQVCKSDALFFLGGWEESRGALLEFNVAQYLGIPCYLYESGGKLVQMGNDADGNQWVTVSFDHLPEEYHEEYPFDALLGEGPKPATYRTPNEEIERARTQALKEARAHEVNAADFEAERQAWEKMKLPNFSDDSKATNPKDAVGSSKVPLHLWPETATALGAMGLLDGMLKYGRNNWRVVGVRWSIYYDAIRRHLNALNEGENYDPDSGLHHMSHILACAAIIVDADAAGMLNDDRQYPGGYRKVIDGLTPDVQRLKDKYADRHPQHYTIQEA